MTEKESKKGKGLKIFFAVFLFLIVKYLIFGSSRSSEYLNVYYVMDFHYGIVSRAFIGEMFGRMFHGQITLENIAAFATIFIFLLILISSFFFSIFLYPSKDREGRTFLLLLLSLSPVGLRYIFWDLGRLDQYLLLLTILGLLVSLTRIPLVLKMMVLTMITVFCFVIHSAFLSILFPIFLIYILYEFTERRRNLWEWFGLIISAILIGGSYFFFQFLAKTTAESYEELSTYLLNKTDLTLELDSTVQYFFFKSLSENMHDFMLYPNEFNLQMSWTKLLTALVILCIELLPFFMILLFIWKKAMAKNNVRRMCFVMSPLLLILLVYVVAVDWCRWLIYVILMIIWAFCLFYMKGNEGFKEAFSLLGKKVRCHRLLSLSMLIYLAAIPDLHPCKFNEDIRYLSSHWESVILLTVFIILYSYVIYQCFFGESTEQNFADRLLIHCEMYIKDTFRKNRQLLIRVLVYTSLFTAVFFIMDFNEIVLSERQRLLQISAPFFVILIINLFILLLIRKTGIPLKKTDGKINSVSLVRYILGGILWVVVSLLINDMLIFSGATNVIYLRGSFRILHWLLPVLPAYLVVFNYSKIRDFKKNILKNKKMYISLFCSLFVVTYSITLLVSQGLSDRWITILYFVLKILSGTLTVFAILLYFCRDEAAKRNNMSM